MPITAALCRELHEYALTCMEYGLPQYGDRECLNIARRCFMVDDLPRAHLARYECDPHASPAFWNPCYDTIEQLENVGEIILPTFELSAIAKVVEGDYRKAFYMAAKKLLSKENAIFFDLVRATVNEDHIVPLVEDRPQSEHLNQMLLNVEGHDLVGARLVMTHNTWEKVRDSWGQDFFNDNNDNDRVFTTGIAGHVFCCDIHTTADCEDDEAFILAPAQFVGVLAVRTRPDSAIVEIEGEEHVLIDETIAMSLINSYATSAARLSIPQAEFDALMERRREEEERLFMQRVERYGQESRWRLTREEDDRAVYLGLLPERRVDNVNGYAVVHDYAVSRVRVE